MAEEVTIKLQHHEIRRLRTLMENSPQQADDRELYLKLIDAEERHEKKFPIPGG